MLSKFIRHPRRTEETPPSVQWYLAQVKDILVDTNILIENVKVVIYSSQEKNSHQRNPFLEEVTPTPPLSVKFCDSPLFWRAWLSWLWEIRNRDNINFMELHLMGRIIMFGYQFITLQSCHGWPLHQKISSPGQASLNETNFVRAFDQELLTSSE